MSDSKIVKIACHSGFWGDSAHNLPQILNNADVDYLVSDYLAETTMSIMSAMKMKNPEAGFAPDFVNSLKPYLRDIKERGIKVISNAGGINPPACKQAMVDAAEEIGVQLKVAVVTGDDLMPKIDDIREMAPRDKETGKELPENVTSMNAYTGSPGIAKALHEGADVVICGRVTDSAVVIGALMHEFKWRQDQWDELASAALAGHIVECVQQATGGAFTDWEDVPGWENVGLPIVEFAEDCSFVVTKPDNTGGLVSIGTVSEQIMYEMGDPAAYILPDVVCDLRDVKLEQAGKDRILVKGARGRPATPTYKVSATYMDGYKILTSMMIGGRDAEAKAKRQGNAIIKRLSNFIKEAGYEDFEEVSIEVIGTEDSYGSHRHMGPAREVILKLGAHHREKGALEIFSKEIIASVLAMAQGTTGFFAGRPKPSPFIRHFSFLLDKSYVPVSVDIDGGTHDVEVVPGSELDIEKPAPAPLPEVDLSGETATVPLVALAWGRSGDKGNSANLGIIARESEFATIIRDQLTEPVILDFFSHFGASRVTKYEMPGILGFNYIVDDVLGGGGASSLRYDSQGKTYAQMLLELPMTVPRAWLEEKTGLSKYIDA